MFRLDHVLLSSMLVRFALFCVWSLLRRGPLGCGRPATHPTWGETRRSAPARYLSFAEGGWSKRAPVDVLR